MAKTRTRKATSRRSGALLYSSAPRRPETKVVEEYVGAPNGSVLILRIKQAAYGFSPELLTIDRKRSLPVSFRGEPRSMQEALRMAKVWLDTVGMRGAN
jgi:hypothetical protein